MQILLALFPLVAYLCLFIFLFNRFSADPVRRILIEAAVVWGVYLALSLELLSIFKLVTVVGLIITWLLPILLFALWAWRTRSLGTTIALPRVLFPASWLDRFVLLLVCVVLLATGLVAWITPPQTPDSVTYHLPRVAHWAQDRSVWHYVTGIDRQTSMPPGAEEQILNFYVLTQSDRLSNFPEWLAMLGSLVGVSLIAYYLGAKSAGQWLAVLFAATIPMGIVEASSTINDYVATFWVVCAVVECLAYYKRAENRALVFASIAGGMVMFTKPVGLPFMLPFALWLAYLIFRRQGFWNLVKWGCIALLIVGLINAGYVVRNYITYGALANPVDFQVHYNQIHSPQGIIVTTLKNIGAQVGIPGMDSLNYDWYLLILKVAVKLGMNLNDPRMTAVGDFKVAPTTTYEDATSNPLQAYLIFALFIVSFFLIRRHGRTLFLYVLLAASTFLLFSVIYKWNAFGTRYDLAFFVIFAPAVGVILAGFDKLKTGYVITALLFIGALPWLFGISSRPLIPSFGLVESQKSILTVPRQDMYFANSFGTPTLFTTITDMIKSQDCKDIGLMLLGEDPEYLLWTTMGAPRQPVRFEWIIAGPTDKYSTPNYQPCAIICDGCSESQSPIRGLEIAFNNGNWWLYLPPDK